MNFFGKIFSSEKTEKLELKKPKHGRKGTQDDLDMEKIGLGRGKKGGTLRTPRAFECLCQTRSPEPAAGQWQPCKFSVWHPQTGVMILWQRLNNTCFEMICP